MGNRSRLLITLVATIVVAVFAWLVLKPREPRYNGKSLTEWLVQLEVARNVAGTNHTLPESSREWIQASNAVRQIGTNGIPVLLQLSDQQESRVRRKFISVTGRYGLIDPQNAANGWRDSAILRYVPDYVAHARANLGWAILGAEASNAVPELLRIAQSSPSDNARLLAIQALGSIGPAAKAATPFLIRCTTNENCIIQLVALGALDKTQADPQLVVPVLIQLLTDPNEILGVRSTVLVGLKNYGPAAQQAGPVLAALIHQMEEDAKLQPASVERDYLLRGLKECLLTIDAQAVVRANLEQTIKKK